MDKLHILYSISPEFSPFEVELWSHLLIEPRNTVILKSNRQRPNFECKIVHIV